MPVSRKVPHSLAEVDNGQVRAPRCHMLFQTNVRSSPVCFLKCSRPDFCFLLQVLGFGADLAPDHPVR